MSDAIRIEQRLHELEQRLHDMVAGWGRRNGAKAREDTPREMERRAVEHLFTEPRRGQAPDFRYDVGSARETEREAMRKLYGGRPTVVVEPRNDGEAR